MYLFSSQIDLGNSKVCHSVLSQLEKWFFSCVHLKNLDIHSNSAEGWLRAKIIAEGRSLYFPSLFPSTFVRFGGSYTRIYFQQLFISTFLRFGGSYTSIYYPPLFPSTFLRFGGSYASIYFPTLFPSTFLRFEAYSFHNFFLQFFSELWKVHASMKLLSRPPAIPT